MVTSLTGLSIQETQPLSIRLTFGTSEIMANRPGIGSISRSHNPGPAINYHSAGDHGGNSPYPFTTLSPARANLLSRRHSMTVQDMLNPSDEEPRRSSQSRLSPPSSENEGNQGRHRGSSRSSQAPKSTPRGQPARMNGRNTHHPRRHGSRRPSPSSSSSDGGERERRGFREMYTEEQTHFIWYFPFLNL